MNERTYIYDFKSNKLLQKHIMDRNNMTHQLRSTVVKYELEVYNLFM